MPDILEVAKEAAHAGGAAVAKYFRTEVPVATKEAGVSYNLVSQADLDSEAAILNVIRRAFPEHGILAEETQQDEAGQEHLWVVDPIDGTNNFIHGVPHFAISVAYYRHGQPVCGFVYNPATGDEYEASVGQGARHNGNEIRVSNRSSLDQVLVGVGFYYDRGSMMEATLAAVRDLFQQKIHGIRRFGTASLDLCQVACGMFGAYFEYELSPWDFAAGRLIVTEAGGRVTNCQGKPLPLAKTSLLASNSLLHDRMLEIVSRHYRV
jgi:myo-inositol-1(or 4)-monophosphatase